jgi:hypothetical protein
MDSLGPGLRAQMGGRVALLQRALVSHRAPNEKVDIHIYIYMNAYRITWAQDFISGGLPAPQTAPFGSLRSGDKSPKLFAWAEVSPPLWAYYNGPGSGSRSPNQE